MKKTIIFIILITAALIIGGLIGKFSGTDSWLAYSKGFSFGPATLDLSVLTLTLGISFMMNVAQLIFILIAMLVYPKICKLMEA